MLNLSRWKAPSPVNPLQWFFDAMRNSDGIESIRKSSRLFNPELVFTMTKSEV